MPRTKGSKNRPKTDITKDYASQIAEKQVFIASLNTEIASIQKAIEEQKNTLKEKKTALKKAEKEVASLESKKAKVDAKAAEECELPVNLRLKSIYPHKYWIFYGNIGESVVVNTH